MAVPGVREEQAERDRAQPQAEQRAEPQAGAPEEDEHGAGGPDGQVDGARYDLVRLLGEAGTAEVRREESRDPEHDAHAEQRRRGEAGGPAAEHRTDAPLTGPIVPGASMLANRVHAADQPSGVSGHRSSGWVGGAPVIQMP